MVLVQTITAPPVARSTDQAVSTGKQTGKQRIPFVFNDLLLPTPLTLDTYRSLLT